MIDDHSPALRAFHTIARHGSFTRAAAELEVTPSALSQAMRQLEQRMGVRLLQRSTRKVGLTEAGRQFLERIGPALAEIDGAVEALRQHGDHPAGTLRITAPHSLLDQLLAPMLADFLRACPDVTLDLIADNALTDLVADGVDAGIRLGERLARDVVALPLGGPLRAVVAGAPAYFARHGRPQHPRELQQHVCARFRYRSSGAIYRWEFADGSRADKSRPDKSRAHKVSTGKSGATAHRWFEIDVNGPLITNEPSLPIRAALDGLLLVHMLEPMVREHIAAGRLQTVLDAWLPPFDGFYLYYPSRLQVPPKLRAFIDFLRERLEPSA
ncbi:LysR family transcriptional regulator [Rhodanobacter glycinis]|uniref:LysR family transcriptional regulator n=1 Tax=Rhodanobacter glycinis TaxID=582702 RepID=UPI00112C0CB9|nr:LysR family transcriptional regulator [Rhodanobacter glycinis]TPG50256.1 LysR family transcriptional regulator [Rhodanobacter glycinis]